MRSPANSCNSSQSPRSRDTGTPRCFNHVAALVCGHLIAFVLSPFSRRCRWQLLLMTPGVVWTANAIAINDHCLPANSAKHRHQLPSTASHWTPATHPEVHQQRSWHQEVPQPRCSASTCCWHFAVNLVWQCKHQVRSPLATAHIHIALGYCIGVVNRRSFPVGRRRYGYRLCSYQSINLPL